MTRKPVAAFGLTNPTGGADELHVVCDDGTAWWRCSNDLVGEWEPSAPPIPGTHADLYPDEEIGDDADDLEEPF